jgi:integrase
MLAKDGQSLKAIQTRLGHKDPGMTMKHYLTGTPAEGAALAKRAAELLLSKPKTTNKDTSVPQMSPESDVP